MPVLCRVLQVIDVTGQLEIVSDRLKERSKSLHMARAARHAGLARKAGHRFDFGA